MRPKFGSDDGYEFRVFFDVHKSEESGMGTGRMWACCLEHKKHAIRDIIKDINVGLRGYRPAATRGGLFPNHIQRRGGRPIARSAAACGGCSRPQDPGGPPEVPR